MHTFSDKEYANILDSIVVACVDVLVCDSSSRVLLGSRTKLPLIGWWLFGGRMNAHETIQAATYRAVEREIGVKKYTYEGCVGSYLLDWPERLEQPRANGCTHLLLATKITIDEDETPQNLCFESHDEIRWFNQEDLKNSDLHSNLIRVLKDAGILN